MEQFNNLKLNINCGKLFYFINQSINKLDEYKENYEQFCNLNPL